MLRCEHCGGLLREQWDYCGRCGADVPLTDRRDDDGERGFGELLSPLWTDLPAALRRGLARLQATRPRLRISRLAESGSQLGSAAAGRVATELRRAPALAPHLTVPHLAVPHLSAPRLHPARLSLPRTGPGLRALGASLPVVALVVLLGLGLVFIGGSAMQARTELGAARQGQSHASLEVERLSGELAAAEATIAELRVDVERAREELAALEGRAAGSEEQRAELSAALDELRDTLADTETALQEREAYLVEQQEAIELLYECLSGMQVAYTFARDGQRRHADRAFDAASEACEEAEAFR